MSKPVLLFHERSHAPGSEVAVECTSFGAHVNSDTILVSAEAFFFPFSGRLPVQQALFDNLNLKDALPLTVRMPDHPGVLHIWISTWDKKDVNSGVCVCRQVLSFKVG
jgi:hypothetical protein